MIEFSTEPLQPGTDERLAAAESGATVPVPQPLWIAVYQSVAFALSALLSPYLVIPVGTVGVVASQRLSWRGFILWTGLSVFFSTIVPALFVLFQIWRGKITDVHVMEREQRGGPFLVAILSSGLGAMILYKLHAPTAVWEIGVVLAINGLVLFWITAYWKISMHVAVLSSTVLAAMMIVPDISQIGAWRLLLMVPALIWARVTRKRHSLGQGVAACFVAGGITWTTLYSIRYLTYHLGI